ncbi:shikimate dehydrogenase [Buchnera aphidicola (Ceratovacuna keduensis)]|uniref:shikimate dehydrogenase n=1 Tax=Buchnera aphidicola TaxID=9 RepID=UPI0031B87543
MVNLNNFSLFGNPVSHSLSPIIHKIFSKQINIKYFYNTILTPKNCLKIFLKDFFKEKYNLGANVTLPYKKKIIKYIDVLTKRAKISGSVNTLKKIENNFLLGDNTDGIGILDDLKRLNFLKKKNNILIIGAGGASYGIVPNLISKNNKVYIYNRTFYRAKILSEKFNNFGNLFCLKKNEIKNYNFNLIINATSSGVFNKIPDIPKSIISKSSYCYDLYFQKNGKSTPFLKWCKKYGSIYFKDGIGMLVSQAAHSCFLWHKKFPNVEKTIIELKKKIEI